MRSIWIRTSGYSFIQVRKRTAPGIDGLPEPDAPRRLSQDALYEAFNVVTGLNIATYSDTGVSTAYQGALERLLRYVQTRDADGTYCAPITVWWIDWYATPLPLPVGGVFPATGSDKGNDAAVCCDSQRCWMRYRI